MIFFKNGLFLKFPVYIVKIDKKQNPLKYLAETCFSLQNVFGLFIRHLSWSVAGGGAKVSKHPVGISKKMTVVIGKILLEYNT